MLTNRKRHKMIKLGMPDISAVDWMHVIATLRSGQLANGPRTEKFEKSFARAQGCEFAVAVNSGTTAISLMLEAGGIRAGDEVVVPSFSWVATANAVKAVGAIPVFCDLGKDGFLADQQSIISQLSPKTKGVLVVHQFGELVDITGLKDLLDARGVQIFEDAACAVGAYLGSKKAGAFGIAAAFSLHPRKVITTGEGGIVCTNDSELADRVRALRNHGINSNLRAPGYAPRVTNLDAFETVGFNYRLSEIAAALGSSQLTRLESMLDRRARIAGIYSNELSSLEWLELPRSRVSSRPSWQSFVIKLKGEMKNCQKELIEFLREKGIEASVGSVSIHETAAYRDYSSELPLTEKVFRTAVALPMHSKLTKSQVRKVARHVKQFSKLTRH